VLVLPLRLHVSLGDEAWLAQRTFSFSMLPSFWRSWLPVT
jgi:hypothetical protein